MDVLQNLVGKQFGKLTVLEYKGKNSGGHSLWLCSCECGNTKVVSRRYLYNSPCPSCGCERTRRLRELARDGSKHIKRNDRGVVRLDPTDGKTVFYKNIQEAGIAVNKKPCEIRVACERGDYHHSVGGYIWAWDDTGDWYRIKQDMKYGVYKKSIRISKSIKDLRGMRFGKLLVLSLSSRRGSGSTTYWICRCDCGNICEVRSSSLISSRTHSCGCTKNRKPTHPVNITTDTKIVGEMR